MQAFYLNSLFYFFFLLVVEKNSKTKHLHCMLHRYALACKTLPPELRSVLDDVVHMTNTIKSSSLKTRLFSLLFRELESDHETLLYRIEVHWLSGGNVIRIVESLKKELSEFFRHDNKTRSVEFIQKLSDSQWLQRLTYLSVKAQHIELNSPRAFSYSD